MRTKNLNLKKKIAFIASVAMIASTAAYLPAEVTQNIGGITASAAATADTTVDAVAKAYVKLTWTTGNTATTVEKYIAADGTLVASAAEADELTIAGTATVNATAADNFSEIAVTGTVKLGKKALADATTGADANSVKAYVVYKTKGTNYGERTASMLARDALVPSTAHPITDATIAAKVAAYGTETLTTTATKDFVTANYVQADNGPGDREQYDSSAVAIQIVDDTVNTAEVESVNGIYVKIAKVAGPARAYGYLTKSGALVDSLTPPTDALNVLDLLTKSPVNNTVTWAAAPATEISIPNYVADTDTVAIEYRGVNPDYTASGNTVFEAIGNTTSGKSAITTDDKAFETTAGYTAGVNGKKEIFNLANITFKKNVPAIDTFKAYVKVNGGYIGVLADDTKESTSKPLYKTFASLSTLENDNDYVIYKMDTKANDVVAGFNVTDHNTSATVEEGALDPTIFTAAEDDDFNTSTANESFVVHNTYKYTTGLVADRIALPNFIKPTDKVTIAVVPNATDASGIRGSLASGTSEVEINFDSHGFGSVSKNASFIEVEGKDFKEAKTANDVDTGHKDRIDFSDMQFVILDQDNTSKGLGTPEVSKIDGNDVAAGKYSITQVGTTGTATYPAFTDPKVALKTVGTIEDFQWVKSAKSGVYAKNYVVELDEVVKPGATVVIDLKKTSDATVTGSGVSEGKLSVKMGTNGFVTSSVVTVSTGIRKEYYTFTVVNAKNTAFDQAFDRAVTVTGLTTGGFDLDNYNAGVANTNVKIKAEEKSESVNGNQKFVKVYTISTNDPVADYSIKDDGTTTANKKNGFTVQLSGSNKYKFLNMPSVTTNATPKQKRYVTDSGQIAIIRTKDNAGDAVNSSAGDVLRIYPKDNTGANYKTPIIAVYDKDYEAADAQIVGYIKLVFTTEYEIPLYNASEDDGTTIDATEIIGYAKVNGLAITKPEDAKLGGWTFKEWDATTAAAPAASVNKVFGTTDVQVGGTKVANYDTVKSIVNPNAALVAKFEENKYTINYNANGGWFTGANANTPVETNEDDKTTVVKTDDMTAAGAADSDAVKKVNGKAGTVEKTGFEFKGWAATPDATEVLTYDAFKKIRPTEKNGNITLYAIWKANEVTVNFYSLKFDAKGKSLVGTSDTDYDTQLVDGASLNDNATVEYKAGEAIGTLPIPTLRGYSFEGWYRKKETVNSKNVTEYSAVRVTADTKILADYLDETTGAFTLYAKFRQNEYSVETDLNGGKLCWVNDIIDMSDATAVRAASGNAQDVRKDTYGVYEGATWYTISKDQYKDSPAPIATYKYNAGNKSVLFYDKDDNEITDEVEHLYEVRKGSGAYDVFQGFYINNETNATKLEDLNSALSGFAELATLKLKAMYDVTNETSTGSMFLDAGEGKFYQCESPSFTSPKKLTVVNDFTGGGQQAKDSYVSSVLTVKDNTIRCDSYGAANGSTGYFIVARPGYTFKGWYTDETYTKQFNFEDAKYEGGKELKAYAKWEADTVTRYKLKFNIVNSDGSFLTFDESTNAKNPGGQTAAGDKFEFYKSYMGTTDEVINAGTYNGKERVIEFNGKKYVFDKKLSANDKYEKVLEAEFADGDTATNPVKDGLKTGKFVIDSDKYTVIEGVFVEQGTQSAPELEAPTNVKVKGNKVTWTGCEAAVKYQVKKIVPGEKAAYTGYVTDTQATLKSVPEKTYNVAVIAFDKDGNKKVSAQITVTPETTTLKAPTNVKVSNDGVVTWDAAEGAVQYQVLKVVDGDKAYTAKTTKLTTALKSTAKDYEVYVIAFDANGKSIRSEKATGKAFTNGLGVVKDAKYNADTKTVTWSKVDNATKYQVLKVVNGKKFYGPYVEGTSYTFKTVPDGAFAYYVIAKDDAGNSTRGTMNKVTNHPSVTDVKLADDNKTVTFKGVEGATGYQLCKIAPGKNPAYTKISTNTTITFANACTSGTQVYVLAFFDEAHKDASYSETIIVK